MREKKYKIYLYLLVPVLFYTFFVIVPFFLAIYFSLFNWKGGPNMTFIGFGNYERMFADDKWLGAIGNNFEAMLIGIVGMSILGYLFALLLTSRFVRMRKFYRFVMFLPVVLSGIVVGYMFNLIFNESPGLLNSLLRMMGLDSFTQLWLGDSRIAMGSISFIMVWQGIGLHLVVYMASLQNVSQDILDASIVDGCTGIKQAFYITTPMMKSTLRVSLILTITNAMKMFEYVYITTKGSPGGATYVMTYYTYQTAFEKLMRLGYSCALVVTSILISMLLVIIVNLLFRKEDVV